VDLLAPLRRFDRFQQRHAVLAFPLAVVRKYGNDQGGNLVSVIAYNAFFSLFPLLLVFTTVLGYVLHGDPSAQKAVLNSALGQFPVIGGSIKAHSLTGNGGALAVGIAGSIWGGLRVTLAAQNAFDQVWAVPFRSRPDFLFSRLRGLGLLVSLGVLTVITTVVSALVAAGVTGAALTVLGVVVSLLLDFVLFFAVFRLLTANVVATRELLPGIITAAILWELLQLLGGYLVGHSLRSAQATYGTFYLVIGLLVWLHLAALATIYAVESNVVRHRHLWPRSLFGNEREEDRDVLRELTKVEERDSKQTNEARFSQPPSEHRGS
jgi:membrane protein